MPNSWKKCCVAIGLLAVVVGTGACRKERKTTADRRSGSPNLLLITLDTTRADRIGAYGDAHARTPNLDRLAREGVRIDRVYAPAPLTLPSHVSILTGREPPVHQVRNNGTYSLRAEETTLAETLKAAGYSTQAMIAAFVLEKKFGLAQGFTGYDDTLDKERQDTTYRSEITADRVYGKFVRWLNDSPVPPFFCWVHFYDPHAPYEPPKHLRESFRDDPYRGE
ncbi:MAG TPA: sulfatase-like hydrolase/transferase, partial [Candidatus Aminicenantes bacterium]|nr:sulfatase-like hydrolase/transferase [Candidatus Aminicenantes bacterium]